MRLPGRVGGGPDTNLEGIAVKTACSAQSSSKRQTNAASARPCRWLSRNDPQERGALHRPGPSRVRRGHADAMNPTWKTLRTECDRAGPRRERPGDVAYDDHLDVVAGRRQASADGHGRGALNAVVAHRTPTYPGRTPLLLGFVLGPTVMGPDSGRTLRPRLARFSLGITLPFLRERPLSPLVPCELLLHRECFEADPRLGGQRGGALNAHTEALRSGADRDLRVHLE